MAVKDKRASNIDCAITVEPSIMMEWSSEEEIQLFKALNGLKPVGINKHIFMAHICNRLSASLKRDINPDVVWAHLHTLYNLERLESLEHLRLEQRDFVLPTDDVFAALMAKKLQHKDADGNARQLVAPAPVSEHANSTSSASSTSESAGRAEQRRRTSDRGSTASPIVVAKSRTTTPQPQPKSTHARSSVGTRASTPNSSASTSAPPPPAGSNNSNTSSAGHMATPHTSNAVIGGGSAANSASSVSTVHVPSVKSITQKELDKKLAKLSASAAAAADTPRRPPKRTRGSKSIESNSPSTTPPPSATHSKRRRI